jgi:hypothetical protein
LNVFALAAESASLEDLARIRRKFQENSSNFQGFTSTDIALPVVG